MDSSANIISVFMHAAGSEPGGPALIHDGRSVSYDELLNEVRKTAGGLRARRIGKGDAVLVLLPMSIELYTAVLALFYLGAVPVFLDAWSGRRRLAACLKVVPCKALIGSEKILWLSWLFAPLRRIAIRTTPRSLSRGNAVGEPAEVDADDTALVTFTTGSTGSPKAADRTHRFLKAQLNALRPILPKGRNMSFTSLPIVVLLQLAMGKPTVLPPARYRMKRPRSIRHLTEAIRRHEIADLVVSPSVMALLADEPSLPSVRHIITGGGPVFPDLARRIVAAFPRAQATIVFGSTEAEPISHIPASDVAAADAYVMQALGLPVGPPDPSAAVRIIPWHDNAIPDMQALDFSRLCLHPGTAGEIVVSGAHVLAHYVNNPEAEADNKIRVDGSTWHRTGDVGRMDQEGRLHFLGRCQEMIYLSDRTIFPVIVADSLTAVPGISGAALFQKGDGIVVILEAASPPPSVRIAGILAGFGIARPRVVITGSLPRDPRHRTKVDYDTVLRKYGGNPGRAC